MSTTIDAVIRTVRAKQERALDEFAELVRAIADRGEQPAPEHVEAVLGAAGKSGVQLRDAVAKRTSRIAWARELATLPGLDAERVEIVNQIDAQNQRLAEAQARRDQVVGQLAFRVEQLDLARAAAYERRAQLQQTCDDEALVSALSWIRLEASEAGRRALELRNAIESHGEHLRAARDNAGVSIHQRRIDRDRAALQETETAIESLRQRERELLELMIEP